MNHHELAAYINDSIETLVRDALKCMLKDPREAAFLMKYALSCKKSETIRANHESRGLHIPAFLIASITSNCNLYCAGCYARANHMCTDLSTEEMLSDERWAELFDEAVQIGVSFILLAGGEPLLRREIIQKAAGFHDILFPIFTNGTLIDEHYLTLFEKNRNLIPILSLEGGQDSTDMRRGKGTYSKLTGIMQRLRHSNILYGTSITVTTTNLSEVTSSAFIQELQENGCRIVFYVEYVPIAEGTGSLAPTDRERALLETRQDELRREFSDMIFISFPGDEKYTGGCLAAGRGFFHINPYGSAEPCPFSPYSDSSLKTLSLVEALRSPLFEQLNRLELVGGEHDGGCTLFAHEDEVKRLFASRKGIE